MEIQKEQNLLKNSDTKKEWARKNSIFESLFANKEEFFNYNSENVMENYFYSRTFTTVQLMGDRIQEIDPSIDVMEIVEKSIIDTFPTWEPSLLLKGFYIVFPTPYKNMKSLWGLLYDKHLFLCGEDNENKPYTGAFLCNFVDQQFYFGDFNNEKYSNKEGYHLVKFLITFSLIYDADKTPLQLLKIQQHCSAAVFGDKLIKIVTKINLKEEFIRKQKEYALINVKGFFRLQACGKNWEDRKIIYIAPFERMQLMNSQELIDG